jgi:putative transposase
MATTTSTTTGQPYGVRRVCQVWGVPRSSFYAAQAPKPPSLEPTRVRRGPKPAITDDALLAAIKRDLTLSPWTGEGHLPKPLSSSRLLTRLNFANLAYSPSSL